MNATSSQVSPATHADAELASGVRISVMRLARRLRSERESADLTLTQLSVLGTLWRSGPLTAGDLAAEEKVKPPSMTRTIDGLERLGHVTRRPHESDGRIVVVELTASARDVIEIDRRRRDAWLSQQLDQLTAAERELLAGAVPILERLGTA